MHMTVLEVDTTTQSDEHTYCAKDISPSLDFDFTATKCAEKWFTSVEEARNSIERFKCTLSLTFQTPTVKLLDDLTKKVQTEASTRIPHLVIKCEKLKSAWTIEDSSSCEIIKLAQFTVSLQEILRFPSLKSSTHYGHDKASILIKKEIANPSGKLSADKAFCVKIRKEEFSPQKVTQENQSTVTSEAQCSVRKKTNVQAFSSLSEGLKAVEQFEVNTATKFIHRKKDTFKNPNRRIWWEKCKQIPYTILSSTVLECQHAKDRNKSTNEQRAKKGGNVRRRRMRIAETKKKDCKACINLSEIETFPQFEVIRNSKTITCKVSEVIRSLLAANDDKLVKKVVCLVEFPTKEDHSGHAILRYENEDINKVKGFFTGFIGSTFEDFLASSPYEKSGNNFSCKVCFTLTQDIESMNEHLSVHYKKCNFVQLGVQKVAIIPCTQKCDEHVKLYKSHHYHCPFCNFVFGNRYIMKQHVKKYAAMGECVNQTPEIHQDQSRAIKKYKASKKKTKNKSVDEEQLCWKIDAKLTYFVDKAFEEYIQMFSPDSDCPLCSFESSSPLALEQHLYIIHLNHSVCFIFDQSNYCCLPCKRNCLGGDDTTPEGGHYHCPCCEEVIQRSSAFEEHINTTMGSCSKAPLENKTTDSSLGVRDDDKNESSIVYDDVVNGDNDSNEEEISQPCMDIDPLSDETFFKTLFLEMQNFTGSKKRKIQTELLQVVQSANNL